MNAAVLDNINAPLRVAGLNPVASIDFGQVRVKMLCAGVCGAQLQEIRGEKGDPSHLPHMLGHEGCGIVQETGFGVTRVKRGDKVVVHWRKGAGCNVGGAIHAGDYGDLVGSGPCTTWAEYVTVSENRCTPIPDNVPNGLAALLGCALSTALATIENETKWGQSILIIGCGGVGLSLILAAKANHLWPIVATDKNEEAVSTAQTLGAEVFRSVHDLDHGFDAVIDTTGVQLLIMQGVDALNPSGKFIMIGQPPKFDPMVAPRGMRLFEGEGKTIKATQAGGFNPDVDLPRYVSMWRSGALNDYPKIIGHVIALDQVNDGINLMQNGKARGRVMIEF